MSIHEWMKIESVQDLQTLFTKLGLVNNGEDEVQSNTQNVGRHKIFIKKKRCILSKKEKNFFLQLKQLKVSCELTQLPKEICKLKYLTSLSLNNNNLENLPNEIGNLFNLVKLELSGNKLNCLPKTLKQIHQLTFLDISHNKFSEVPDVLNYGLRLLKVLDISGNEIRTFDAPACLNELIVLDVSSNALRHLPDWIFSSLCRLQILNVSNNSLCLHQEITNVYGSRIFESLQVLNIENCSYNNTNIQIICNFKNLEMLQMGNKICCGGKNFFGNFSINKIQNLKNVKYLYLQNVQIATLPSDIDFLKGINILDLSNNLLSWLPDSFCDLTFLKIIYLTSNQLFFLPKNIGKLINLQQIHLASNKLEEIPESFYYLPNLEFVDLYDNKISLIDEKIFKKKSLKGIDLELNFLNSNYSGYESLRSSFRECFGLLHCRRNSQTQTLCKAFDELSVASETCGSKCSTISFDSEQHSDFEDSPANVTIQSSQTVIEDEDWEKNLIEFDEDDLFDPNEIGEPPTCRHSWSKQFLKNYCPANYHVPSLMPSYRTCFKLSSEKETVEEGQCDSD